MQTEIPNVFTLIMKHLLEHQEDASSLQGNFNHAIKVREKLEKELERILEDIEDNNSLIKALRRQADALHFKLEEE